MMTKIFFKILIFLKVKVKKFNFQSEVFLFFKRLFNIIIDINSSIKLMNSYNHDLIFTIHHYFLH